MKKINPIIPIGVGLVSLGTLGCGSEKIDLPSQKTPNIVLIMADDMGYGVPGCYGGTEIFTPNIDKLALHGMRFTNAYAGCALCAPSRASLLLGQHMGHVSLRGNTGGISILDQDVTFAEVMKKGGYQIGGFGKWGIGDLDTPGVPEKQGFDEFFGYYHQIHAHFYYTDYLIENGVKVIVPNRHNDPESYTHNIYFNRMTDFIRDQAESDQPFFCFGSWVLPHTDDEDHPQIPTSDPAYQMYADKPWTEEVKKFAAMHTRFDTDVGKVMDLLEALGIADNTLLIVSSDNGGGGEWLKHFDLNRGLRGAKRTLFEGGLRVPFVASWPGKIKAGSVSDHPFYFADMMATFAELSGTEASLPKNDGISIVSELLGKKNQKKHDALYWENPVYSWSKHFYPKTWLQQAVRMDNWKLVRHKTDEPWELYDLSVDPQEEMDISKEHPEMIQKMVTWIENNRIEMIEQIEPEMPEGKWYR